MNGKTNDSSTVLIDYRHNRVGFQNDGFVFEEVNRQETIGCVAGGKQRSLHPQR